MQGGIGLGERDYYFENDAENVRIRKEYVTHLQKMMEHLASITPQYKRYRNHETRTDLAKASRKMRSTLSFENYT